MKFDWYLSAPLVSCYDNEGGNEGGQGGNEGGQGGNEGGQGSNEGGQGSNEGKEDKNEPRLFTQEDVNRIMAENKKNLRAALEKAEAERAQILDKYKLTEEERQTLEEAKEDWMKQLRTKEEQAKEEQKRLKSDFENKIAELSSRAEMAEKRYTEATITRALQDAAHAEDAFNADIVVTVLRDNTKLVDDKPMVDFEVVEEETGETKVLQLTPADAVKRMKDMPEKFGGLFKPNIVSGIGGSSSTGGLPGNGRVDVRKLTPEQYSKLRKENPAAIYGQ